MNLSTKLTETEYCHECGLPIDIKDRSAIIKKLRKQAHQIAEHIWGKWNDPNCDRKSMYKWLSSHTKSGHIGKLNKEELEVVIAKLYAKLGVNNIIKNKKTIQYVKSSRYKESKR